MFMMLPFSECASERCSLRKAILPNGCQILVKTQTQTANVSFVITTAQSPMIFVRRMMSVSPLRLQQAAGPLFALTILLPLRIKT